MVTELAVLRFTFIIMQKYETKRERVMEYLNITTSLFNNLSFQNSY